MYTGLIDHCGEIIQVEDYISHRRLHVATQFNDLTLGESIAVDGACLTVASLHSSGFMGDVSAETLSKTIAGTYQTGSKINLERCLAVGDRLGGHYVLGHVDQTAVVSDRQLQDTYLQIQIAGITREAMAYLIPKGSITVNGVSLTINAITQDGFSLMLIPHTLSITNLSALTVKSPVNIEFDIIAKCVLRAQTVYQNLATVSE